MIDSTEENSLPNDCADEEVEIRSDSYEEITIIITGKEAKLVLLKELPTDSPAYNIKSKNDDSEDSKHKYRPRCSELEKEKEGAETDEEHLKNHSRRNLCEAKVPSEELEKLGDEVDFPDSVYKDELLKRNFEGPHEKLCEAKNSRLNEEGDAGSGIGATSDCGKHGYIAKSEVKLRFGCGRCDFATVYRGALQRHVRQTHGLAEKKHRCDLCGFATHRKSNLEVHVRTHTNQKPFKCDECDYASAQRSTLKQHVLYRHSERGEKYKCAACSYTTNVKHSLAVHVRIHTSERKPLRCATCDYETPDRNKLNSHLLETHGEEVRRYRCANCCYSTHVRRLLVVHMAVHSNRKPFGCKSCEFKSASKSSLRTHVLLKHSGELKRYRCEYCGYSTHISGHLIRHVRTHTNEKPYKCKLCDFASAQSGNLKHHVFAKHGHKIKNDVNSRVLVT